MTVWYEDPNIAHRLGHPFVYPGGPSVIAEPAAARRQTVQHFHEQATAAWSELLTYVVHGLPAEDDDMGQQQHHHHHHHQQQQQQQQQQQHQHHQHHQQQQQHHQQRQQQQQEALLDLSGLAAPLLPRKRLTGPVLLVPQPDTVPFGMTPDQATAAAVAAARAAHPGDGDTIETLVVPPGCLQLHSWRESAAAEEPPGEVAASMQAPSPAAAAAAGRGAAAGRRGRGRASASAAAGGVGEEGDDVMQPGSEVLVTLAVMDTSGRLGVVQQEIQALGSNTLSDVRDAISCPTDRLADGLGAANPAAYFYLDQCFYDDTRAAAPAECSQVVEQWARRCGFAGPRHLLQHYELPEDAPGQPVDAPAQQQQQQQQQQQDEQQQEEEEEAGQGDEPAEAGQQAGNDPDQQQQQQREQRQRQPGRDMQHVRLRQLVLQASNRPMGLFSHQGLCEHAVVVKDVRLLHAADPNHRSAYPRTVFKASLARRLHCGVCKRLGACALLLDHPETPEAVVVLCRLCSGLFGVEGHPGAKLVMLEEF